MVFLRSLLNWLTSRETTHFPSPSKLIRTSSGVNGNNIESSCGKCNSKYSKFDLVKLPMMFHISSKKRFTLSIWHSLWTTWKVCWNVIQFISYEVQSQWYLTDSKWLLGLFKQSYTSFWQWQVDWSQTFWQAT